MTPESLQRLRASLIAHEGQRFDVYTDTLGYMTVGVGHNLSAHGISQTVCDQMLNEDIARALHDAARWPWFATLTDARQAVIVELVFNIGGAGVGMFTAMIAAIEAGNWEMAALELLNSKWARQVGRGRSQAMADAFLAG